MPTPRTFVSYASEDAPFVRRLGSALRGSGLHVWIDERELRGGSNIVSAIGEALASATH